jgi:hypothetical protein
MNELRGIWKSVEKRSWWVKAVDIGVRWALGCRDL